MVELLLVIITVVIIISCVSAIIELVENDRLQKEEMRRKQEAFLRWYATLPDEQKYLVDQQIAQANSARAMQALMGLYIMHEYMHHDQHNHFPFP